MAESKKAFATHLYHYAAQVLEVMDGDTLRINLDMGMNFHQAPKILRLSGINAPECRTTNLEEKKRGLAAKLYLSYLAPIDSWILLVTEKDLDEKYGRIFGEAWAELNQPSINQQMVDAGHSREWDGKGVKPG